MHITVSGITQSKDGVKVAYVCFEDEGRMAELTIPDRKLISNKGFDEEEMDQINSYLMDNMTMLKKTAAGINPFTAMMK